jgi:PAS domain S-box-containing protein
MNAAGLAMLEAGSISEVKSHSLLNFILPEYRAAFISLHRRVMNGESGVLEFEVVGLRGTRRWLSTHAAPMRDTEGRVTMLLGITRDITGHKQAEDQRARLATIVENANDAIMSRSLDGTILTWNAGAEKMLGYTAAEAIGKSSNILIPANRKSNRTQNTEALLSGRTVLRDTDRLTKDGRVIAVLSSQSPLRDGTGKIVGSSVILQDITERNLAIAKLRQSEALNDSVLNSLSAHVAVLDQNGFIIAVNEAWRTFAQSNSAPTNLVDPVGVNYLEVCQRAPDFHHGEEAPAVELGIRAVLRGEQPLFLLEYPCHSPYEQRWFQLRVTPLQGSRSGVVISHENITPRKMAEAAHASLEAQLRESQKMQAIGTLAGGIAHDFNNALATILGNAELARQDSAHNPPALESLEKIRKAGTRARNLVQQILAFSRRQPAVRKPIDLALVVSEATHLLRDLEFTKVPF